MTSTSRKRVGLENMSSILALALFCALGLILAYFVRRGLVRRQQPPATPNTPPATGGNHSVLRTLIQELGGAQ